MKKSIYLLLVPVLFNLSACGNKTALKDRSHDEYKQAQEAPPLILPDSNNDKYKKN